MSLRPLGTRMALGSKKETLPVNCICLEWGGGGGVAAHYLAFIQSILMNAVRMAALDLGVRYVIRILHTLGCLKPISFDV